MWLAEENRSESELSWDRLLHIKTTGRDDSRSDHFHYPYEPTPYSVLERLANSGYIRKKNILVDYGCGKARVGIFLANQLRCRSVGIEYDERIFRAAEENAAKCVSPGFVSLEHIPAEAYEVKPSEDRFYFFNPFSEEILRRVIRRILDSWYEAPRQILLFFYYPSPEYEKVLSEQPELSLQEEIPCGDLFPGGDAREKILVYEAGAVEQQA